MIRTDRKLADGRQILYFDTVPAGRRDTADTRELPAATSRSEVRFDAALGEWVVIASHRQSRTFLPPADQCPLCPSTPERPTEVPESDYQVVTFENRFPSLGNGSGRCEVVCFTSDHTATFADLSRERARLIVDVWADRTAELSKMAGVGQVFCFENHGEEIGVTLAHPHGQIYAYPFVTPRAQKILANSARYRSEHGRNLLGDLLAAERDSGIRVVASNEHWTAFVPLAARWPYEVQLLPHRQVADIPDLDDAERDAFAELYLDVLGRFARRFDEPMPYVAAWNQAPTQHRDDWWLHLQLFSIRRAPGKLKYLAGSESAMNVFINDTTPEDVAAELRAVT